MTDFSCMCTVLAASTGDRKPLSDLPQGRLEVPCNLNFEGEKKYIQKIQKLLINSEKTVEKVATKVPSEMKVAKVQSVKLAFCT